VIGRWIAVKNKSVHCTPCTVNLSSGTNGFGLERDGCHGTQTAIFV